MQIPSGFFSRGKPSYLRQEVPMFPMNAVDMLSLLVAGLLFPYTNHLIFLFLWRVFCTMDLEASIFYQYIHTFLSQAPAQLWAWVDPACGQVHNILNTTRCINKTPKNIMHFDFPPFHTPQKRRGSHDLMAIFMGVRVPWAFKVFF